MKKIIVCPDSFKESISSAEAGLAMADGIHSLYPDAEIKCLSVADGGEGTLDALTRPQDRISVEVSDPVGRRIVSEYGFFESSDGKKTAVIEIAKAAGLDLVHGDERDPLITGTYGVGEMISDALDRCFSNLIITLGGSATNDGGCGMAAALGVSFFDSCGKKFIPRGKELCEISRIDISDMDKRLMDAKIYLACDVRNPLVGENGASYVYAPQKGAPEDRLEFLDAGMRHYAEIVSEICGRDVSVIPGSGVAGGLGIPLIAFCGGVIESGISAVLSAQNFDALLNGCGLVLTGEGRTDAQSLCGKAICGIAERAKAHGVPVFVLSGSIGEDVYCRLSDFSDIGIAGICSITDGPSTLEFCMKNARTLLKRSAARFAMTYFSLTE